ncbi:Glycosyl transferase CAP10 domain-containing protein [Plasmodiophora brassicae]
MSEVNETDPFLGSAPPAAAGPAARTRVIPVALVSLFLLIGLALVSQFGFTPRVLQRDTQGDPTTGDDVALHAEDGPTSTAPATVVPSAVDQPTSPDPQGHDPLPAVPPAATAAATTPTTTPPPSPAATQPAPVLPDASQEDVDAHRQRVAESDAFLACLAEHAAASTDAGAAAEFKYGRSQRTPLEAELDDLGAGQLCQHANDDTAPPSSVLCLLHDLQLHRQRQHGVVRHLMRSMPARDLERVAETCTSKSEQAHSSQVTPSSASSSDVHCDLPGVDASGHPSCSCTVTRASISTKGDGSWAIGLVADSDDQFEAMAAAIRGCGAHAPSVDIVRQTEPVVDCPHNASVYLRPFGSVASALDRIASFVSFADLLEDRPGTQWVVGGSAPLKNGLLGHMLEQIVPVGALRFEAPSCASQLTVGVAGWVHRALASRRGTQLVRNRARNALHTARDHLVRFAKHVMPLDDPDIYGLSARFSHSVNAPGRIAFADPRLADMAFLFDAARDAGFQIRQWGTVDDRPLPRIAMIDFSQVLVLPGVDSIDEMMALRPGASVWLVTDQLGAQATRTATDLERVEALSSMLGVTVTVFKAPAAKDAVQGQLRSVLERWDHWSPFDLRPALVAGYSRDIPPLSWDPMKPAPATAVPGQYRLPTRVPSNPVIVLYYKSKFVAGGNLQDGTRDDLQVVPGLTFVFPNPRAPHMAHWVENTIIPPIVALAGRAGEVPRFAQYRVYARPTPGQDEFMNGIERVSSGFMDPPQTRFDGIPDGVSVQFEYCMVVEAGSQWHTFPGAADAMRRALYADLIGKPLPAPNRQIAPCRVSIISRASAGRMFQDVAKLEDDVRQELDLPVDVFDFHPSQDVQMHTERCLDGPALTIASEGNALSNLVFMSRGQALLWFAPRYYHIEPYWGMAFADGVGHDVYRLVPPRDAANPTSISEAARAGGPARRWEERFAVRDANYVTAEMMTEINMVLERFVADNLAHCY